MTQRKGTQRKGTQGEQSSACDAVSVTTGTKGACSPAAAHLLCIFTRALDSLQHSHINPLPPFPPLLPSSPHITQPYFLLLSSHPSSYSVHTSLYTHSPPSPPLPGSQGSLSAPRYIKSKASSSDQHMDDLCRRVAAQALSDDPLDGMSISLSSRSSVRM